jgi:hypothetical protein
VTPRRGRLWWPALPLVLLVATAAPGGGQQVAGLAVGPDGQGLVGIPVVLHRVGGGTGALVATDTSGPDGTFHFEIATPDSAVYFAAVRYEGRLYVGPAIQAGADPVTGYILRVEPRSEAGAVGAALSRGAAPARPAAQTRDAGSDLGAFLLVGLLALAAATAFIVAAPRYRERRTRETLVELAGIENRLDDPDGEPDREALQSRRDSLRERLAPRS